jgi:hypothetical protein
VVEVVAVEAAWAAVALAAPAVSSPAACVLLDRSGDISQPSNPADRAIPESRPSVRFDKNTIHAASKSLRAWSNVSAVSLVHSHGSLSNGLPTRLAIVPTHTSP